MASGRVEVMRRRHHEVRSEHRPVCTIIFMVNVAVVGASLLKGMLQIGPGLDC